MQAQKDSLEKETEVLSVMYESYSAIAQNSNKPQVLCYLWTMSETDDKKLSILLENISAPFLKKLIWKKNKHGHWKLFRLWQTNKRLWGLC